MTNKDFVEKLKQVEKMSTVYVLGGYGVRMDEQGRARAIAQYDYNKKRETVLVRYDGNSFGFDCSGLIKGVLWGFTGDKSKENGGSVYCSNGVPDWNTASIWSSCREKGASIDISEIVPGEYLYMYGHCGIYVGNGEVIESSPEFQNKVQTTKIWQRSWAGHGKLIWIDYEDGKTSNSYLKDALIELENAIEKVKDML